MKRPYTGESWTRFKELMQNLIKRTAIVETRAQNNEDDIAELKPAVEDLQEFADNVNDMTTGINLIRGSMDFKNWTHLDQSYVAITKQDDGFSVLNINNADTSKSWFNAQPKTLFEVEPGEIVTFSFEIMIDDVNAWIVNNNLQTTPFFQYWYFPTNNYSGPINSHGDIHLQSDGGRVKIIKKPETFISGKWHEIVFSIEVIPEATSSQGTFVPKFMNIAALLRAAGSINFRKFNAQRGHINDPIYSVAPGDLALEPINDITTGINLLRGTRDFSLGKTYPENIRTAFTDGFINSSGYTFSKDTDGFSIATKAGSGSFGFYGPLIKADNLRGSEITVFADILLTDSQNLGGGSNCVGVGYYNASGTFNTILNVTLNSVFNNKLVDGEWKKAVIYGYVPEDAVWIIASFNKYTGTGAVSYKKCGVYKGHVENPEWSANPFDYAPSAVNDITTMPNLLRGTRDFSKSSSSERPIIDGFSVTKPAVTTFTKDEEGFTVAHIASSGNSGYYGAELAQHFKCKQGDYTFCFEFMVDDASAWDVQRLGSCNEFSADWSGINNQDITLELVGVDTVESGLWYKAVYRRKITNPATQWIRLQVCLYRNGSINFRKLCVYEGDINNAIWAPAPSDYASSYEWNNGAPKLLGARTQIKANDDLNEYTIPGSYACYANANVSSLQNKPDDLTIAFTLDVEKSTGNPSVNYYLRQIITAHESPSRVWVRECTSQTFSWMSWRETYVNTTVRPIEGGGTGANTVAKARTNLKINEVMEINPINSLDQDTYAFWTSKPSGIYRFNNKKALHGLPDSGYTVVFHYLLDASEITQFALTYGSGFGSFYTRSANFSNKDKVMSNFTRYLSNNFQPYNPGLYAGTNLATKFSEEIGSNHIANWLASRASNGNFEGLNIGDWVDIACTGATRRYIIAAIDPYYNCGYPTSMSHHLLMIPITRWILDKTRDGDYYTDNSNGTIRWNKTNTNNGTSTIQSPYMSSNLHKWETEVAIKQFPQEWQDVMIDRIEMVETRYSASSTLNSPTGQIWQNLGKLWSLSEVEVYGACFKSDSYYNNGMSTYLPIFSNPKFAKNNLPSTWLRDVSRFTSDSACILDAYGPKVEKPVTNNTAYPAPCFLIG